MADTLTEDELKTAYARELLKTPKDPFKAALAVIGDAGRALLIARDWVNDVFVLAEQARLLDEQGPRAFLPTKEDFARKILDAAEALDGVLAFEDKLKGFRLFAEVMGYIEKPNTTINNNPTTVNRVMVVKDHGSEDDWERRMRNQQAQLIAGNGETRH